MRLEIDYNDETNLLDENQIQLVMDLLQYAAEYENMEDSCELSLSFVNNDKIQEINREYRGKDQPTDVISFALEEMGEDETEIVGEDLPRVLGDIIISVEKTKAQSIEYGHSFNRELGFLAVHGFLHLLGYDHQSEAEEKIMFAKQEEVLQKFGLTR